MINKVILVGRLGVDPEVVYLNTGDAAVQLSLATSEKWKDKNTGQMQESTEWHRVKLFKAKAENAGKYLTKGSQVYIEGRLKTRKWQDETGADRYVTEVVGDVIKFLGGGDDSVKQSQTPQQAPQQQQRPQQQQAPQRQNPNGTQKSPYGGDSTFDGFDDDIPF